MCGSVGGWALGTVLDNPERNEPKKPLTSQGKIRVKTKIERKKASNQRI